MDLFNLEQIIGLIFILVFVGLMFPFALLGRRRKVEQLREISAFTRLVQAIRLAVEDGTRLHLSIGRGSITGPQSAAAFVALSMLRRIARIASVSDRPPVVTSGDGALTILAQDTLQSAYQAMGIEEQYESTSSRLTGATPFSFASGTLPIIHDEMVSSDVMAGSFGNEVALITDTSARRGNFSLGGTDNISGQAILYATTEEPLIGEELYAAGAYLGAGPIHAASLHAQDVLRLVIVIVLVVGAVLEFFGFLP